MNKLNLWNETQSGRFSSAAIAVADDTDWVEIATIPAGGQDVLLEGAVGAGGALAHLKITQSVNPDGDHRDLAVDADLATATRAIPYSLYDKSGGKTGPHVTPAEGSFQLLLASGAAEYTIWAKKASGNTTLTLSGRLLGVGV